MNKSLYTFGITLLAICLFISCNESDPEVDLGAEIETESDVISITSTQFQKSNFEVGPIEKRSFQKFLSTTGSVHLPEKNKAAVSSFVGGTVSRMDLIHGQWVKKGQKLFSLSNPELITWQQEYLVLQSEIEYLQEEYGRQKQLSDENITAKKNLKKSESELKISKAKSAGLAKKLSMIGISPSVITTDKLLTSLAITAPSSGYISEINVKQGMFLEPFETAMEVSNTNHLHMELKVMERDLPKLKKGQEIQYSLQDDPNTKYKATIYLIEKLVNEDRMINVHCHLEEEQEKTLIPGMFITAEITLEESEVYALPEDAVVLFDGHHYVLEQVVKEKYDFQQKIVEIGQTKNGFVQLMPSSSLDSSATYLTKGAYYLILGEGGGHSH